MRDAMWMRSDLHIDPRPVGGDAALRAFCEEAKRKGMESLCFAPPAGIPFLPSSGMTPAEEVSYRKAAREICEAEKGSLRIAVGLEKTSEALPHNAAFDLFFGCVTTLSLGEERIPLADPAGLSRLLREVYASDPYRLASAYFEAVATLPTRTHCDILSDLDPFFLLSRAFPGMDERDPRYLRPAVNAMEALLEEDVIFEVATDAPKTLRRPTRSSPALLGYLAKRGGRVALSSRAGTPGELCRGFREAVMLLRAAGFGSVEVLLAEGWRTVRL